MHGSTVKPTQQNLYRVEINHSDNGIYVAADSIAQVIDILGRTGCWPLTARTPDDVASIEPHITKLTRYGTVLS